MRMKRITVLIFILSILFSNIIFAEGKCSLCGMRLDEGKRMHFIITTKDGKKQKACNQGCAILFMENIKKEIKSIETVDYNTGSIIDANIAFYVKGSDVKPVMGGFSVVAFPKKEDAERFRKEHGGTVMTANELFKAEGHSH